MNGDVVSNARGARGAQRAAGSARRGLQWLPVTAALAGFGALAWLGATRTGWLRGASAPGARGVRVERGPLRVSVIERGNLRAAEFVSLKSEVEGQTTILYLVKEGAYVEEGQLLCELDATQLVDKRVQQEISVSNAEATHVEAEQNLEIQASQNESDFAKAQQELDFARLDLEKFQESDRDLQEKKAKEEIDLAGEESVRAKEKLEWSEKLAGKGFLTDTELQGDRLAAARAQIMHDQAQREHEQLLRFEFPRQLAELEGALKEAERELERVRLQAKARIVDDEASVRTSKAKLDLEVEKLSKLESQIAKAKLIAPRAGMVVYGKQEEQGRFGSAQPIAEGTTVRERQEIITIPNAGGMLAQASIHESVLNQVRVGQTCVVKVEALPGVEFEGEVQYVAVLPDQGSWWANPNARLYRTDVTLVDTDPEMRPGMSCSIEILVEDLPDALYVPVQAVFHHLGENLAFVTKASASEVRQVEVGRYTDKWVQVLSGLAEGEEVLMSPPEGFVPQSNASGAAGVDPDAPGPRARNGEDRPPQSDAGPAGRRGADARGAEAPFSPGEGRPRGEWPRPGRGGNGKAPAEGAAESGKGAAEGGGGKPQGGSPGGQGRPK